jgi:hypothetical protein
MRSRASGWANLCRGLALQWSNWVPSVPSRRPIEGPCVRNDPIDRENARCGETHDHLVVYQAHGYCPLYVVRSLDDARSA